MELPKIYEEDVHRSHRSLPDTADQLATVNNFLFIKLLMNKKEDNQEDNASDIFELFLNKIRN